ncbi:MAG: hypothetical protein AAF628_35590 [Planctomycetota bacterium]
MKINAIPLAVLASLFAACGDGQEGGSSPAPAASGTSPASGHGAAMDLGTVTVAGKQFGIMRLGDLKPGHEGAFEVHPKGVAADELAKLSLYLWVESKDGTQLSAPEKGHAEGDGLHFHCTPKTGAGEPFRAVLRVRAEGVDERGSLPLDGHGHEHGE